MAAPTNAASEDSPCQPGAVHTWPIGEVAAPLMDVRSARQARIDLLTLSSSHFGPISDITGPARQPNTSPSKAALTPQETSGRRKLGEFSNGGS